MVRVVVRGSNLRARAAIRHEGMRGLPLGLAGAEGAVTGERARGLKLAYVIA